MCADPGVRTPISTSGNFINAQPLILSVTDVGLHTVRLMIYICQSVSLWIGYCGGGGPLILATTLAWQHSCNTISHTEFCMILPQAKISNLPASAKLSCFFGLSSMIFHNLDTLNHEENA